MISLFLTMFLSLPTWAGQPEMPGTRIECRNIWPRGAGLRLLREGLIRPDVVRSRLAALDCYVDFIKEMKRNGWKVQPTTVSLQSIVFGDEGHDQSYRVAVALRKNGPRWRVFHFFYSNQFFEERIRSINELNEDLNAAVFRSTIHAKNKR